MLCRYDIVHLVNLEYNIIKEGYNMKRIICALLSIFLFSVSVCAETQDVVNSKEKEMYDMLMQYDGHTLLTEYMTLENNGASDLIVYACALADKYEEFEENEVIKWIKEKETGPEVECVLLEMLNRKHTNLNELVYLQDEPNVEMNTKQLLLISDDINEKVLKKYIYQGTDYRAKSAAQMLSFKDDNTALFVALDLLRNYDVNYYHISAINVIVDQYYRYHPNDNRYKGEIINRLLDVYQISTDEQEHFWIMDALGWMQDYELLKQIIDNDEMVMWDKYTYLLSSNDLVKSCRKTNDSDIKKYIERYDKLLSEEVISQNLYPGENTNTKGMTVTNWRGYAVYRVGNPDNPDAHAAIMHNNTITGGTNYYQSQYLSSHDVIHATSGNTVSKASWYYFLAGQTFICACRPNTCSMTNTDITHFIYKGTQLLGIAYSFLGQIGYTVINDGSKIEPTQITTLRCDGVVEYVYEYYGYRVCGGNNVWDISLNLTNNFSAHYGYLALPSSQYNTYLTQVTTIQYTLY